MWRYGQVSHCSLYLHLFLHLLNIKLQLLSNFLFFLDNSIQKLKHFLIILALFLYLRLQLLYPCIQTNLLISTCLLANRFMHSCLSLSHYLISSCLYYCIFCISKSFNFSIQFLQLKFSIVDLVCNFDLFQYFSVKLPFELLFLSQKMGGNVIGITEDGCLVFFLQENGKLPFDPCNFTLYSLIELTNHLYFRIPR